MPLGISRREGEREREKEREATVFRVFILAGNSLFLAIYWSWVSLLDLVQEDRSWEQDSVPLFSWVGKVFVAIYWDKVEKYVLCMSNGLKQWECGSMLTNIAINYLIDCLIYFFLSYVYIIVVLINFNISFRKRHAFDKWKLFKDLDNVLF